MAIESQGIQLRRISTVAGSTAAVTSTAISFDAASKKILRGDAGSFITDGFSSAMRVESNSTVNKNAYTIASLVATALTMYETILDQSSGTNITLTGHTFNAVGEVIGFNGPSGSAGIIDVTSLASTAKEKMLALRDEGQVTIDVNLNTSADQQQIGLKNDRATRTRRIFDIKLTDQGSTAGDQPTAAYFDAYVSGFSITGSVDNVVKSSITLELSSAVKWINKT